MSRIHLYGLIFLFLLPLLLSAQAISQMEFRDQPIRDILLVLAEASGQSIIADETVTGNASYYFNDTQLDLALTQFLGHYGIFYHKDQGIYYVSRIQALEEEGKISCRTENVDLQLLLTRLSRDFSVTILYDPLPVDKVTINYQKGNLKELLEILIKPYPFFSLEQGERYYYLRKDSPAEDGIHTSVNGKNLFVQQDHLYSADLRQIRFRDGVIHLMEQEGVEFSFLGRNDNVIEYFHHQNRSFQEMLDLLMEQGNAACQKSSGIYYIFDLDRQDILKQYYITRKIGLQNLSVERLNSLIPSSLGNSGVLKIDKDSNSIIVTGTIEETAPLLDFISLLDSPMEHLQYFRFDLQFISLEELRKGLSAELQGLNLIGLGENSFICALSEAKKRELENYLRLIDQSQPVTPVKLRYLTWDSLQQNIPAGIDKSLIIPSSDPCLIFFRGSQGQLDSFLTQLDFMDRPTPQIRYEVLVLQIEENHGLDLDMGLTTSALTDESSSGFSGTLSGLTSLTFDVVSRFGYQFAANLSLELSENRSRVLADTTLHGLSGEEISFQNTNTSRIATTSYDVDTEEYETTGYREITSGLMIEIEGWVSGDGMITLQVQSTISNETSSDKDSGSIPTTTEKVINSHVRTPSGEPIILSGLKQRETVEEMKKVPFLGDIPLLGLLFKKRTETMKNTEFIITLIPYREQDPLEDPHRVYKEIYERYCRRDLP